MRSAAVIAGSSLPFTSPWAKLRNACSMPRST
jgi:hypothetical protein